MKQLKALSDYIRELHHTDDDTFDSWTESGELLYSGSMELVGFEPAELLYRLKYIAVFHWEQFHGNPYQLFADMMRWLAEQDYDFDEFGNPEFDSAILDDNSADVQVRILFEEPVYTQPETIPPVLLGDPDPETVERINVCGGEIVADD